MKQKLILTISALLLAIAGFSGPARRGPVCFSQPDGSTFYGRIRGDEFIKITMTEAGSAIIQDEEGWWCYATYDEQGRKQNSGFRVGSEAPAGVMAESRNIPYGRLTAEANVRRRSLTRNVTITKSSDSQPVTKHGLIILVQFKDVKFTHERAEFINMLTQKGYNKNGAHGCAEEYFRDQFNGLYDFRFDVSPVVTLTRNISFYGANVNGEQGRDSAPEKMVIEACRLADEEVDFSLYDDDGDGWVDNVFLFFAGADEAEGAGDSHLWSHAWELNSSGERLTLDGMGINSYACTAELTRIYSSSKDYREVLAGIGTFCHEYFHTFGIPDMYDTDYSGSGGTSGALWSSTSLMDAGNQNNYSNTPPYLNAVERSHLGISEPVILDRNGGYVLEPIHKSGKYYRLNTDNDDEYYLFECREEEGWDRHIGGNGMLVYHIDKSDRSAGYSDNYGRNTSAIASWRLYNEVNSRPSHQCADLIEADTRQDSFAANEDEALYMSLMNIRGIFFPTATTTSLLPDGQPGLKFWSGAKGEISVTNIRRTDEGIAFNVLGFSDSVLPPSAAVTQTEVFPDAAIILFESDREFEGEAVVKWGRTGSESEITHVKPYAPGKYAVTLEGLIPDNKTYTAKISFELDGLVGDEESVSFMTKKAPAVKWPFIYMNGVATNSDGTLPKGSRLPLRLCNAGNAGEITWEFNDSSITTGGAGYYTVEESGSLIARIIWKDGSEEIIMKEIIIGEDGK